MYHLATALMFSIQGRLYYKAYYICGSPEVIYGVEFTKEVHSGLEVLGSLWLCEMRGGALIG